MKKIVLLLSLFVLIGCSAKTISWQDVEVSYSDLNSQVQSFLDITDVFSRNDFIILLNDVKSALDTLAPGITEESQAAADSLYESALMLKNLSSSRNEESNVQISALSDQLMELVKAAYEKSEDFASRKESVTAKVNEVLSWPDEMWLPLEKKKTLSWKEVESDYELLIEEADETLTRRRDITEAELEDLKNYIIANFKTIAYGVEKSTRSIADELYVSGYKLKAYTDEIDNDAALTVNALGSQTMEYVEKCYGSEVDDPDYDFERLVNNAEKWTLSLLNEVTSQMRRYR